MVAAALWLTYRVLTAPGELGHLTRFVSESGQSVKPSQLVSKVGVLQGKINQERDVLEDLGNPDGLSRLPAGATPTVPFAKLRTHCPALQQLPQHTWIEIDESGQVLAPALALGDCHFEPYRGPNGRPVAVRALYVAK